MDEGEKYIDRRKTQEQTRQTLEKINICFSKTGKPRKINNVIQIETLTKQIENYVSKNSEKNVDLVAVPLTTYLDHLDGFEWMNQGVFVPFLEHHVYPFFSVFFRPFFVELFAIFVGLVDSHPFLKEKIQNSSVLDCILIFKLFYFILLFYYFFYFFYFYLFYIFIYFIFIYSFYFYFLFYF